MRNIVSGTRGVNTVLDPSISPLQTVDGNEERSGAQVDGGGLKWEGATPEMGNYCGNTGESGEPGCWSMRHGDNWRHFGWAIALNVGAD